MNKRQLYGILFLACLLRIGFSLIARNIIDIQNYERVATTIIKNGIFSLYVDTKGIYPYPPPWMFFEVLAQQISEATALDFGIIIRIPIIIADLGVNYLIIRLTESMTSISPTKIGYLYALNPISLIIVCFHGQFDSIALFFIMASLYLLLIKNKPNAAALMISTAIAFKSFPVLLIIPMLGLLPSIKARIHFIVYAITPVIIMLLPFLVISPQSVIRELVQYRGVALLGVMVPIRTLYVTLTGESFPVDTTFLISRITSICFIISYLLFNIKTYRQNVSIIIKSIIIFLLFYSIHAGISPQYTYWIIPILIISSIPYRLKIMYLVVTMSALIGFYLYAVPEIFPMTIDVPRSITQIAYGFFGTMWWCMNGIMAWWLIRNGLTPSTPQSLNQTA